MDRHGHGVDGATIRPLGTSRRWRIFHFFECSMAALLLILASDDATCDIAIHSDGSRILPGQHSTWSYPTWSYMVIPRNENSTITQLMLPRRLTIFTYHIQSYDIPYSHLRCSRTRRPMIAGREKSLQKLLLLEP